MRSHLPALLAAALLGVGTAPLLLHPHAASYQPGVGAVWVISVALGGAGAASRGVVSRLAMGLAFGLLVVMSAVVLTDALCLTEACAAAL